MSAKEPDLSAKESYIFAKECYKYPPKRRANESLTQVRVIDMCDVT